MIQIYPSAEGCAGFSRVRLGNGICGIVAAHCVVQIPKDQEFKFGRKVSHPASIGIEKFARRILQNQELKSDDEEKVVTKLTKSWFDENISLESTDFVVRLIEKIRVSKIDSYYTFLSKNLKLFS